MAEHPENKNSDEQETTPIFDKDTDRRIHEHLSNQNDQISEDDIRNVRTSMEEGIGPVVPPETPIIPDPKNTELKDDRDPDVDTASWGVLES